MSEQGLQSEKKLEPKFHRIDPINFYDVVINVNSLANIQKQENKVYGWEIKAKPENYEKYLKNIKEQMPVLGVIGQGNRGKSYILSKISNIPLPSGYSVTTEGLSVKYPDPDGKINHKIIVLDSAGSEPPIKETNNFNLREKFNSQKAQKEIALISRDKKMTETFLQNFIIHNANIVILVIGQLTLSEQKMYNKLKNLKKKIFVVHNLFNFVTINQVTDYIDNTLLQTMMMKLEKQNFVKFESSEEKIFNQNKYYYTEKIGQGNDERTISHFVIAKEHENSEAGNFFNPPAFAFLKTLISAEVSQKPFDIINKLKEYLVATSVEMIEPKIEDDEIIEENVEGKKIIYVKDNNGKSHELKHMFMNELGLLSYYSSNFVPKYSCVFSKRTKEIIIQLEFPGAEPTIKLRSKIHDQYNIFTCNGQKTVKNDSKNEKKIHRSSIKDGKFEFNFKIPVSKGILQTKKFTPEFLKDENNIYNGIVQFKIPIEVNDDSQDNDIIEL